MHPRTLLFALALVALSVASAQDADPANCVWGDGECARRIHDTEDGLWSIDGDPTTYYASLQEWFTVSDGCKDDLTAAGKPLPSTTKPVRYTFSADHPGAALWIVWNSAAKTIVIFGRVFGGPLIATSQPVTAITGRRYECRDTGFYRVEYNVRNVAQKVNGALVVVSKNDLMGVPNASGMITREGSSDPSIPLGIQVHPGLGYSLQFDFHYVEDGQGKDVDHAAVGWTDITVNGRTHKGDWLAWIGPDCECDPMDPGSECVEFVASNNCTSAFVETCIDTCICLDFTANRDAVTVECAC